MRYIGNTGDDAHYSARLLGTYELELEPAMADLRTRKFSQIVVVGAAEGYYAVGLAIQHPEASIVAFEASEKGRRLLNKMAALNKVSERISISGFCDVHALSRVLQHESLVIMDVEGDELELLNNIDTPSLANAVIIVEIHDFIRSDIYDIIIARFRSTHIIDEVWELGRNESDFPFPALLENRRLRDIYISLMDEARPTRMRWLIMKPMSQAKM